MKIVEKIVTILSQKRYRNSFFVLGIFLSIAIVFPLRDLTIEQIVKYKITDVKDSIELALIVLV